jgi:hypothetical protein
MQRVTVKTSTIFIAKGGRTRVYHSVQEVPRQLRQQLEDSTNGFNSATILIADRRGREELLRALKGMPSALRTRVVSSMQPQQSSTAPHPGAPQPARAAGISAPTTAPSQRIWRFVRRNWLEMILPGAVGAALWLAFNYR